MSPKCPVCPPTDGRKLGVIPRFANAASSRATPVPCPNRSTGPPQSLSCSPISPRGNRLHQTSLLHFVKFSVFRGMVRIYVGKAMYTYEDLQQLRASSLKMQSWIRQQTFSPRTKRPCAAFPRWEVAELIFKINQSTFRGRLAAEPDLPGGEVEPDGRQRWFSLDEINELRRKMKINRKTPDAPRPAGQARLPGRHRQLQGRRGQVHRRPSLRPCRRAGRLPRPLPSTSTRRPPCRHSMGLTDVAEDHTVWGIMARDLIRETDRMNAATAAPKAAPPCPAAPIPASIRDIGLEDCACPTSSSPPPGPPSTSSPPAPTPPSSSSPPPSTGTLTPSGRSSPPSRAISTPARRCL